MTTIQQGQTTATPRSRTPKLLRKLTSSETTSLDLDQPAALEGLGIYDGVAGGSIVPRAFQEVASSSRKTNHYRSASGTSQFSTTTSGSGHKAGTFVHPYQQTPRPYTPPIVPSLHTSYQNSIREGDGDGSDSPVLTEDDEDRSLRYATTSSPYPRSSSNLSSRNNSRTASLINASTCSPSLVQAPLRVQTKLPASSLYQSTSHTDLNDDNSCVNNTNPQSPRDSHSDQIPSSLFSYPAAFPSTNTTPNLQTQNSSPLATNTTNMSPISPTNIRSSFDRGFRIRSRSDLTPAQNREAIHEARRKFEERERMKEEKAATDALKVLEKRYEREAKLHEKEKASKTRRRSSAERSNRSRPERSRSDLTNEKVGTSFREDMDFDALREGFYTGDYQSSMHQSPDILQDGFEHRAYGLRGKKEGRMGSGMGTSVGELPRRSTTLETTKRKTQSTWTRFMMWLRTRLMRMRSSGAS